MLRPVKEMLNLPKDRWCLGKFGVEVEMEGMGLPNIGSGSGSGYWRTTQDSSLRGESAEYVMRAPLELTLAQAAVSELYGLFKKNGTTLQPSIRCGVHVHVNVQELNLVQLLNFVTTYLIFEEVMVAFCGESREGNLFCLRTSDAEFLMHTLKNIATSGDLSFTDTDSIRYASINLKALYKFGSVEFRSLDTTTTPEKTINWIDLLNSVELYSRRFTTPLDVVRAYSEQHAIAFLKDCFGGKYELLEDIKDLDFKVKSGLKNARMLAHVVDWASYFAPTKNVFGKVATSIGTTTLVPKRLGSSYSQAKKSSGYNRIPVPSDISNMAIGSMSATEMLMGLGARRMMGNAEIRTEPSNILPVRNRRPTIPSIPGEWFDEEDNSV